MMVADLKLFSIRAGVIAITASLWVAAAATPVAHAEEPPKAASAAEAAPLLSGALIMKGADDLPHAFEAGWKGQPVCELLQETDRIRMGRCTFPPGVGHEKHWHGSHVGYIVQGSKMRITDETGTSVRDLKTGQSWTSDGVIHEAVNIGDQTAIYIIVEAKD